MSQEQLCFEITGTEGRSQVTRDSDQPVWIGRDSDCDVVLLAPNVSRHHVSVQSTPDGLLIQDASSNGTLVNKLQLRRASRVIPEARAILQVGWFSVRVWRASQRPEMVGAQTKPPELARSTDLARTAQPARPTESGISPIPTAPKTQKAASKAAGENGAETRRSIHRALLENLDLPSLDRAAMDAEVMRPKVVAALRRIVTDKAHALPPESLELLVQELANEALGLGPLEALLADPDVNEIMVVDPHTIFVERRGKMELTGLKFTDDNSVRAVIERIVTPLGRRIDESTPLVDARLKDGSRVNAVIPPLALRGPCITIRKFAKDPIRMPDLVKFGSVTPEMARFLERAVQIRKNIIISGGTGSGKTTLLNVLSSAIPGHERVVTVEDAAELQLAQPHVVSLEARPPNLEGKGEYSIRDLVKNALRMRPDRIVVGECRGGEAIDMLQAMNTGHDGSLTTTHANSPREAVSRIETLCLMAGLDLPVRAIRQQIASSVHLFVQQSRFADGSRRVTSIAEVVGISDEGEVELREIFNFKVTDAGIGTKVVGEFAPTGYLPSFIEQFVTHGLVNDGAFL
jgi:pilus assembly protein CpaF